MLERSIMSIRSIIGSSMGPWDLKLALSEVPCNSWGTNNIWYHPVGPCAGLCQKQKLVLEPKQTLGPRGSFSSLVREWLVLQIGYPPTRCQFQFSRFGSLVARQNPSWVVCVSKHCKKKERFC